MAIEMHGHIGSCALRHLAETASRASKVGGRRTSTFTEGNLASSRQIR